MDITPFENIYQREIELAQSNLLKGLKDKKNKAVLEKEYSYRLKKARENYYYSVMKAFRQDKPYRKKALSPELTNAKRMGSISLTISPYEKVKMSLKLFFFKLNFFFRKFIQVIFLPFSFPYFKIKNFFSHTFSEIKIIIYQIKSFFLRLFIYIYSAIKIRVIKVYNFFKNIFSPILSFFIKPVENKEKTPLPNQGKST